MKPLLPCLLFAILAACDGKGGSPSAVKTRVKPTAWNNFSGDRALLDVKALVDMGPRPSGSEQIETSRQFIEKRLKEAGWETQRQDFEADHLLRGKIKMSNIRARLPVAGKETWARYVTTLVCSHYDTKWFQSVNFVGANDGGSSTGLLLELARASAPVPAFAGQLELVFFDGEEAITGFTQPGGFDDRRFDGLFGSRHYAKELRKLPRNQLPKHGVVFDMIGDEKLEVEFASNCTPRLVEMATQSAEELGFGKHFRESSEYMTDDHVPLGLAGHGGHRLHRPRQLQGLLAHLRRHFRQTQSEEHRNRRPHRAALFGEAPGGVIYTNNIRAGARNTQAERLWRSRVAFA